MPKMYNDKKDGKHGSEKGLCDGIIVITITYASET